MSRRENKENNMGKTMQRLQRMIMKKRLFDVQVEQIKKYLKKKKKKKTGLFEFTNFLERSIKNWLISRTGYQF